MKAGPRPGLLRGLLLGLCTDRALARHELLGFERLLGRPGPLEAQSRFALLQRPVGPRGGGRHGQQGRA